MGWLSAIWAMLLALLGAAPTPTEPTHIEPMIASYGTLPQRVAVYDHNVEAVDYFRGPLTLDERDFSYVRGDRHFHNPSNLGLHALPVNLGKWANRRLHFDQDCNQPGPLTENQKRAIGLIVLHAEPLPNGAVTWRYDFEWQYLNLVFQPGFNSAFAQAVNIAALLFAECKTKDSAYLDLAKKAALGLTTPISQGGVMNDEAGLAFFEELPAPLGLSPYIQNAHILSTNVLFALAARTGDEGLKHFAELGAETVLKLAPIYDAPKCVRYAIKQYNDCWPDYVEYEVTLLDELYKWTGNDRFRELSEKWSARAQQH